MFEAYDLDDTFQVLCAFNNKYIKNLDIECDESVFGVKDVLIEVDPISKKDREHHIVHENRGITSGSTLGVLRLIEDGNASLGDLFETPIEEKADMKCVKYVARYEFNALTEFVIPRTGDAVSAIYVPTHINRVKYRIAGNSLYYGADSDEETSIYELLLQEKLMTQKMKSVHWMELIMKELECERNQDWKSKWKLIGDDQVEISGQLYKRVEFAVPFLPLVSLSFCHTGITLNEDCSVLIEFVMMSEDIRNAVMRDDTRQLWKYMQDESLKEPTSSCGMQFITKASLQNKTEKFVSFGGFATRINCSKENEDVETLLDEKETMLLSLLSE